MIDYELDVKPLEDQGLSDADIAQHLAARTLNAMLCSEARVILQEAGAVKEDPVTGGRAGSLIDYYTTLPEGNSKDLLAWFISHVMGEGVDVSTNDYPRSVQWASVTAPMNAELQAVAASLIDSAGGQPDAGATSLDVQDARAVYQSGVAEQARKDAIQQLKADIENTWINPAMTDGSSVEDVKAAIKAGL